MSAARQGFARLFFLEIFFHATHDRLHERITTRSLQVFFSQVILQMVLSSSADNFTRCVDVFVENEMLMMA